MKTRAFTEAPLWKWDILPSLFYRKNTTGGLSSSIENTTCPVEALLFEAFLFWSFFMRKKTFPQESNLFCASFYIEALLSEERSTSLMEILLSKLCWRSPAMESLEKIHQFIQNCSVENLLLKLSWRWFQKSLLERDFLY